AVGVECVNLGHATTSSIVNTPGAVRVMDAPAGPRGPVSPRSPFWPRGRVRWRSRARGVPVIHASAVEPAVTEPIARVAAAPSAPFAPGSPFSPGRPRSPFGTSIHDVYDPSDSSNRIVPSPDTSASTIDAPSMIWYGWDLIGIRSAVRLTVVLRGALNVSGASVNPLMSNV